MHKTPATRRRFLKAASLCAGWPLPGALAEARPPGDPNLRLWYRQPAADWNEALPIGNGRLGAMIYGGTPTEHLQLNEDTLYSDEPGRRDIHIDITKTFEQVLGLLRERKYAEAEAILNKSWIGRTWPCYQPLGDLYLDFDPSGEPSGYVRELDISDGVCRVSYRQSGVVFTRETFASHPGRVIVIRLAADKPGALNFTARFESVHPTARTRVEGGEQLILKGQAPGLAVRRTLEWIENRGDQWKYPELWDKDGKRRRHAKQVLYGREIGGLGTYFEARLKAQCKGGSLSGGEKGLVIRRADEAVLILAAASSYNGFDKSPSRQGADPAVRAGSDLRAASRKTFEQLREAHVADYRRLFERVSLRLGAAAGQSRLPTDERIERFANGRDPALAALYFQFGRYLMISGSRPGTQPLNLQGLWNKEVIPPWAGAYTMNINLEMNYWPAEATNLPECHEPLFRLIEELAVNGRRVAKEMYGRRGWVAHHNTTLWRGAQPVDNAAMPSFWPMAGGWLCRHLWEHYLFSGDRQFLAERAYPLMKGAAEFYLDWLVEDGAGRLLTPAGVSPEIRFRYLDREGREKQAGVCMGPTMDMAIIRELFTHCIRAAETLGRDRELQEILKSKLERLLPYRIGSRGQLQEWAEDLQELDPRHRHISHLYPLHPGNQITRRGEPELFEAARRTLEIRGDEGTGWSRAWKINFWARMEDGGHAYKLVRNLLEPARSNGVRYDRGGVMPNLLCSHPPFQIDGNFGGTAGIAEMLLQSHAGEIHLLPALPEAWSSGSVRGLCARGGFELSMEWDRGRLTTATLHSKLGQPAKIRYGEKLISLGTEAGRSYRIDAALTVARDGGRHGIRTSKTD